MRDTRLQTRRGTHPFLGRQPSRDEANGVQRRIESRCFSRKKCSQTGARSAARIPRHSLSHGCRARLKGPLLPSSIDCASAIAVRAVSFWVTSTSRANTLEFKTMAPPRFTCPLCGVEDSRGRRRCDHCRCARCFMALPGTMPCAGGGSKRRADDASRRDEVRSTAPAPLAPNTPLRPPREKRAAAAVCDTLEARPRPRACPRYAARPSPSACCCPRVLAWRRRSTRTPLDATCSYYALAGYCC